MNLRPGKLTRKTIAGAVTAVLICAMLCATLCACGGQGGPTEKDARNYVQALLDLTCTGSYNKSVKLSELDKEEELQVRDSAINNLYSSAIEEARLREDVQAQFRVFLTKAGQKCRYTVTDAVKTGDEDDISYDVTVSIEPLKAFAGASDILDREMKKMENDTGTLINTDPDEIYSTVFSTVFENLTAGLDDPAYEPAESITVHYCLIDPAKGLYGVNQEDCRRMGEKLFSLDGLE